MPDMMQPPMMDQANGMTGQAPGAGEGMDPQALAAQAAPPAPGQEMMLGQNTEAPEEGATDVQKLIDFALSTHNLVTRLAKKKDGKDMLKKVGDEVLRGYNADELSREDWINNNKEWQRLALLVREGKTFPWPKASNIKFPLIATAAMQFSARAYPSLVPSTGKLVATTVPQKHSNGQLYEASNRVASHMSFQLLHRMPNWSEDMDKLLMTIAIQGICFKKTYYDVGTKSNRSYLIYPEKLCVNYWAKDLESAYRKTELMEFTGNEIESKIRNGEFHKFEYEGQEGVDAELKKAVANKVEATDTDSSTPHLFLQQHTFWDLDEDGLEEPYVITVHKKTGTVVRITARFDEAGVVTNEEGKISSIQPVEFYTAFPFIPNPDGSIYALGFGSLLGPLNLSVNTIINQLVDAGTLNNLQSGFIGKGLRIKMGDTPLQPGEWRVVNATGDDLSKSIFPLPSKEPSAVLMNLLQMLIQAGNQLASIAEIFVGKMPGQNTPATTTQETVQQSMAVFTAIYKRVYRSMESEFKKLYRLNRLNPNMLVEERSLAGIELQMSDYDFPDYMIVPGADPAGDSWAMKQQKMQMVGQLIQMGTVNPQEYTKRVLTDLELPDVEALLMPPPQPQPDPKAQAEQQKAQMEQQKVQGQMQLMQQKAQMDQQMKQQELEIKRQIAEMDMQQKQLELRFKEQQFQLEQQKSMFDARMKQMDSTAQMQSNQVKRQMDLRMNQAQGEQKLRMQAAQSKQKASQKEKKNGV
jgi:chaperonin GroES